MKRVLIQYAVGQEYEKMLELTDAVHYKYLGQIAKDCWFHKSDKYQIQGKRPTWNKVRLILEQLNAGVEEVIWLDADSVICDFGFDLFRLCNYGIGVCEVHDSPNLPRHWNCGVLFVKNTPVVREFFNDWNYAPENTDSWADQVAFIELMKQRRYRDLLTVYSNRFNYMPIHAESLNPVIRSFHGHENRLQLMKEFINTL